MRIEVIDHMGSDQRVIDAARVSYGADTREWRGEADEKLLRYLLKNGHWSPFEHCHVTWCAKVPLFVRSQWVRHRSWVFNEISRRYTSKDITFHYPNGWMKQSASNKQASADEFVTDVGLAEDTYSDAIGACQNAYEVLLRQGVAREQARMVLPQSTHTYLYATANLRSALHFVEARTHEGAQREIQVLAETMKSQLAELFPVTMRIWGELNDDG